MAKRKWALAHRGSWPQKRPKNSRSYRLANRRLKQWLSAQTTQLAPPQQAELATRLYNLSLALSEALTPAQVADAVIREGVPGLGARAGSVTLLSQGCETLQVIGWVGYPPEQIDRWSVFPVTAPVPLADAVRLGQPILLSSLTEVQARYPVMISDLLPADLAWAAIPLIVEDRTIGAIGLSFAESRDFGPEEVEFILTLARQCAQALDRARLYAAEARMRQEAEIAQRHLSFMAEASKRLALSLDYETTLAHLEALIVPALADQCFIDLVTEIGTLHRILHVDADPDRKEVARAYERRYPPDPNRTDHPVLRVIDTGNSILIPEITETLLQALARDGEQLALVRQLGMTSAIIAPLTAQGRTFGAISFIGAEPDRHYTPADLVWAEALTSRAALALNNAHLYKQALVEIAERKRAEEALQVALAEAEEGKRTLEALMEYVPEGITIADAPDIKIRYVSRYGQELLGPHQDQTAAQVVEQWRVYKADGMTPLSEADLPLVRAIRGGETVRDREMVQVNAQGHPLSLLCNAAPIRDHAGQIVAGIVAWHDITERKQAEEALRRAKDELEDRVQERTRELYEANAELQAEIAARKQAETQLRQLASRLTLAEQEERHRIGHILHEDLQQLLYGIQLKIEFINQSIETGQREQLRTQAQRTIHWIETAIAKTRQLSVDLSPPVLPEEGLTDALGWLVTQMRELHNLRVKVKAEHSFRIADEGMRVLLFQIIRELLFNVVKHAETDQARVVLREEAGCLVVRVSDEGRGFEVEVEREQGFGLRRMQERLSLFGGRMEIVSQPGEGTQVTIYTSVTPK